MTTAHQYSIRPKDLGAHLYEVQLTVAAPNPAGQVFAIPNWIPGSYMIRDYAKHVVAIRAESDGRSIQLQKLDKSRWQAAATARPLTLLLEIYAYDESVRGAHLDKTHAYFNGSCVFPAVEGQENIECLLDIQAAEDPIADDWRVATSMRPQGAEAYAHGTYIAADYAELIDHPVEIGDLAMGEFDVRGIPHAIAIRGRTRVDMARICHDLQTMCEQHLELLGAPQDLDRYLFLLHAPGKGYGGLEHRWSSSLVCSRDYLPQRGEEGIRDDYRTFLGLASHEYFHLWNIKRLKPAAFTPYDLAAESYTELMWVFEGITSYYDDLILVRSGLISADSYLELVGQMISKVIRSGGRHRQSIAESSFDAWTKFYKQDANAPNAIISYYTKGALIASALDLKLRAESDGELSLDDVMRACWERWGKGEQGMPEGGFEAICAELAGDNLGDFFDAAVRGTGELPLQAMLATVGVDYHLRQATSQTDKGGKSKTGNQLTPLWLGANLNAAAGNLTFSSVLNGGPAEQAGIAPGDVAVALDGVALTAANYDQRLRSFRSGETLELVFFRGEDLMTTSVTLVDAPQNTCYLSMNADADLATVARRAAWLSPA